MGAREATMPREQRIRITLGKTSGNPDADVALNSAARIVRLLESLDKRGWQVDQQRYDWEIVSATKSSPFQLELCAHIRNPNNYGSTGADVVGRLVGALREIDMQTGAPTETSDALKALVAADLNHVAHIGNGKKHREVPVQIEIPTLKGDGWEGVRVSAHTRNRARIMAIQIKDTWELYRPEYIITEGVLVRMEANPFSKKYNLQLIERGNGRRIVCYFDLADTEALGGHLGHRAFVEGELSKELDGNPRLDVQAFRLIPKVAITDDQMTEYGIAPPDGLDALDYIRSMRDEDA